MVLSTLLFPMEGLVPTGLVPTGLVSRGLEPDCFVN